MSYLPYNNGISYTYKLKKRVYGKLTGIMLLFHETHNVQDLHFLNVYNSSTTLGNVNARPILNPAGTKVTASGETFTVSTTSYGAFMVFLTPKFYDGTIDFLEYFEQI